jgi:aspartyl-tRNA(Asn)/glutamyl-tRNA(Gln) amidotransferase subunit A
MAKTVSSPLSLDAASLLSFYRRGKLSPVTVVQAVLAQAEKHQGVINAFCFLDPKGALRAARASEKRWRAGKPLGPLDGLPVTIKDFFHVKGWPTRFGSTWSKSAPQEEDSIPVAKLRAAGAVFIGKTTLPEWGHKGVTDSKLSGITRNPWNAQKTPGGSSGGAAAAAAAGMGVLHLGSDAGGSLRIPASFSGVVGFKPSQGVVPTWPPSLFSGLSAIGPVARSVADCALMMDVIAQGDARDWHAASPPLAGFSSALGRKLPKLKIAFAPAINGVAMTREVAAVINAQVKALSKIGSVTRIALDVPDLVPVFNRHWMAVASYMLGELPAHLRAQCDPRLLDWAARGDAMHLHDYLWAEQKRMEIGAYFKGILDRFDILVTPTTAMAAFDAGIVMPDGPDGKKWDDWTPFTYPANLARLPAISLPAGLTRGGLPVGLQLMAGNMKDVMLLQAAAKVEKLLDFSARPAGFA